MGFKEALSYMEKKKKLQGDSVVRPDDDEKNGKNIQVSLIINLLKKKKKMGDDSVIRPEDYEE